MVNPFAAGGDGPQAQLITAHRESGKAKRGFALAPSAMSLRERVGIKYRFGVYNPRPLDANSVRELKESFKTGLANLIAENMIRLAMHRADIQFPAEADQNKADQLPKIEVPADRRPVEVVVIGGQHRLAAHQQWLSEAEAQIGEYRKKLTALENTPEAKRARNHAEAVRTVRDLLAEQTAIVETHGWWAAEIYVLGEFSKLILISFPLTSFFSLQRTSLVSRRPTSRATNIGIASRKALASASSRWSPS